MIKLGKFLVAGALAAIACVGLVGCGGDGGYKGEYKYQSQYGGYGIGVVVTLNEDKTAIEKVELKEIKDYANVSESWTGDKIYEGALGRDETNKALPNYLKKFEGKTVAEIKAITVDVQEGGAPSTLKESEGTQGDYVLTGATQTSGRIILAIQNALKDVK
jgi:hypothetical protein